MATLRIHHAGDWPSEQVAGMVLPSTLVVPPRAQLAIEEAWQRAVAVPGRTLFDGPMCRLEAFDVTSAGVRVGMSRTSYKTFWGTNLCHPEVADEFGPAVLANPIGVSPALETADGWLLLGRRNDRVAYYPNRVHPFAGSLEPSDAGTSAAPDLFAAVRRELNEELALTPADIQTVRMTGLAEDVRLRQPELIFRVKTNLSRAQVESQVDAAEHDGVVAIAADADGLSAALLSRSANEFTPVAAAALLLFGRTRHGDPWLTAVRHRLETGQATASVL